MFRTVKIELNAANPQMPLMPVEPFVGSAVSVVILNVPRAVGSRQITGVTLTVTNVAGAACGVAATRSGSAWSATIPASAIGTSGTVANGIVVSASGKDEAGATVPQWIIGAGDLIVHNLDSSVTPGVARNTVFWFDAQPEVPAKGNIAVIGGVVKIYNGNEWISMGGGSPDAVTHAEFANVSALSNATLNQTSAKVNEILTLLKGTAALALALCAFAAFGVDATTQFGEVSPTTTVQKVVDSGAVNFYTKGDADAKFFATPKATYLGDELGMLSWFSNQKQLVVGQEDMGELCGSLLVAGGATDPATLKVGSSNSGRGIEMSANCLDNTNTYVKVAGDEIVYGISTNGGLSYLHGNVNLTLPTPVDAYTKSESDAKFMTFNGGTFTNDVKICKPAAQFPWESADNTLMVGDTDNSSIGYIKLFAGRYGSPFVEMSSVASASGAKITLKDNSNSSSAAEITIGSEESHDLPVVNVRAKIHDLDTSKLSKDVADSTCVFSTNILALAKHTSESIVANADTAYTATNAIVELNQSVQTVEVASGLSLTVLAPTNAVKDWIVYANCAADAPLVLPAGQYYASDEAYTNALKAGVTALYFSSCGSGIIIGRQELKPITVQ